MSKRPTILGLLILSTAACVGCERSYVTYRLVSEDGHSIEPRRLADDCYENTVLDARISGSSWYGIDSVIVVGDCRGMPDINRLRVYDHYSGYLRRKGDTLRFYATTDAEEDVSPAVALLRQAYDYYSGYLRRKGDTLRFYETTDGGEDVSPAVALLRGDSLIFRGYGLEQPLVFVRLDSAGHR
jgi:hypothetical protein